MEKRPPPVQYRIVDARGSTVGDLYDAAPELVLGRGLCGVPASDKRCSRKQAEVTLANGSLTLIPRGVNPAYLKSSGDDVAVMLQRNEKYKLHDGDVFTLVANSYPFTVVKCVQASRADAASASKSSLVAKAPPVSLPTKKTSPEEPKRAVVEPAAKESVKPKAVAQPNKATARSGDNSDLGQGRWKCSACTFVNEAYTTFCDACEAAKDSSAPAPAAPALARPASSLGVKRKAQEDENEDEDEDEDALRRSASPERKRPRTEQKAPVDERPVCPYGKGCYRKNPVHFKEHSHPWLEEKEEKKKPKTNKADDDDNEEEEKPVPVKSVQSKKASAPLKGASVAESCGAKDEKPFIGQGKKQGKEPSPPPKPTPPHEKTGTKSASKSSNKNDWMDEETPAKPEKAAISEKKIVNPKASPPVPSLSSSSSSKPSFSVPAQPQSSVSPSGKKTLKIIPSASPTKVAPGARLVLDYNSDEDEEEQEKAAPKQASPQTKPSRSGGVPSLAAMLTQDERGGASTSTSTSSSGSNAHNKPKSGNPATKQAVPDTAQTVMKVVAESLGSAQGPKSLAFPSLGTSILGMQPKRAASIIRKTAKKFLRTKEDRDIRLVLVLESKQDPILAFFEAKRISDPRFTVVTTPITKLAGASLSSAFLATETDWRLRGGGTAPNRMIHEAAGPRFLQESKKLYGTASECGQIYPVPLPDNSPLYAEQEGKRLLKETYKRLFHFFGTTLDLL